MVATLPSSSLRRPGPGSCHAGRCPRSTSAARRLGFVSPGQNARMNDCFVTLPTLVRICLPSSCGRTRLGSSWSPTSGAARISSFPCRSRHTRGDHRGCAAAPRDADDQQPAAVNPAPVERTVARPSRPVQSWHSHARACHLRFFNSAHVVVILPTAATSNAGSTSKSAKCTSLGAPVPRT